MTRSFGLTACLLTTSACFLYVQVKDAVAAPQLKEAHKPFDLDRDGKLNESERVKMYEATIKKSDIDPNAPRQDFSDGPPPDLFGGPPAFGQGGRGGPGGFGGGRRGPGGAKKELVEKYDKDNDGKLDTAERAAAREEAKGDSGGGGGPGGRRGFGGGRGSQEPAKPGISLTSNDVESYTNADLYDPTIIRTLFLSFDNEEWETELNDFYKTDVEVPAKMIVDGKDYTTVGVRFRGNTSSMFVAAGFKKSLNISVDYDESDQRLYGYKTLNLLNAHGDPSMMREVLFSRIASDYMPALKANFVRVVINGENWGLYVNSQQFDKIFLAEAFDTKGGVRWKKPASPREGGGLKYGGDNASDYAGFYQLKTNVDSDEEKEAWDHYIQFAKTLATAPVDQLEEALDPYLDIDQALWFLAMENTFIDGDGYWVRASDFNFYQDPNGRFHMVSHDNNETFRLPGGPGFSRGSVEGVALSPLHGMGEESKPLLRLLENQALQARYLAHVKTIAQDWLNWDKTGPVIESYKNLIQAGIKKGTKRESSFEDFLASITRNSEGGGPGGGAPGLKPFIEDRGEFLLNHPLLNRPTASINSVKAQQPSLDANETDAWKLKTSIEAKVSNQDNAPSSVYLYATTDPIKPFKRIKMVKDNSGTYKANVSSMTPGKTLHYYVEARGNSDQSGSSYYPKTTSYQPLQLDLHPENTGSGKLMISEAMAANQTALQDPQGEFDDWIEIHNSGTMAIDLSNCFLSDNGSKPLKWQFPAGTVLKPGNRLIVWADEDGKATEGLHANFKLSAKGENIVLSKRENGKTEILDYLSFEDNAPDTSVTHQGKLTQPTPGH